MYIYLNSLTLNLKNIKKNKIKLNSSLFYFNFLLKLTLILAVVFIFFLIFSFSLENVPFFKLLFIWASFGFLMYILISGFNFFGKKYSYNRYTEALQRFWKRSFSIFWLLEIFVFTAFFYLTFNASSEIVYSYDPQFFFKTHLISFRSYFFNLVLTNLLLLLFFCLIIFNKYKNFNFFYFNVTSLIVTIVFVIETLQFLSLLNYLSFYEWIFFQNNEYVLDSDFRKNRIVNSYVFLLAGAKYLHVLFIFFIWFFNFSKNLENLENRDFIFSTCLQNTLILYFLNWMTMYSCFKYYLKYYLFNTYSWFFFDFKDDVIYDFLNITLNLYKNFFFL